MEKDKHRTIEIIGKLKDLENRRAILYREYTINDDPNEIEEEYIRQIKIFEDESFFGLVHTIIMIIYMNAYFYK